MLGFVDFWHRRLTFFQEEMMQVSHDRELISIRFSCMHHQIPVVFQELSDLLKNGDTVADMA